MRLRSGRSPGYKCVACVRASKGNDESTLNTILVFVQGIVVRAARPRKRALRANSFPDGDQIRLSTRLSSRANYEITIRIVHRVTAKLTFGCVCSPREIPRRSPPAARHEARFSIRARVHLGKWSCSHSEESVPHWQKKMIVLSYYYSHSYFYMLYYIINNYLL